MYDWAAGVSISANNLGMSVCSVDGIENINDLAASRTNDAFGTIDLTNCTALCTVISLRMLHDKR